jgi:L-iditol 2-dehydrogenase
VFAIDPSQKRLDVAARVAGAEPAGAAELRNVDLVVDATGFPGSFGKAIEMVRDGGTIIEVGAFVNMGDETFNPAVPVRAQPHADGDRRRGPARLRAHARADGPPRGLSIPFAEMVVPPLPGRRRAGAMETALDAERSAKVLITG